MKHKIDTFYKMTLGSIEEQAKAVVESMSAGAELIETNKGMALYHNGTAILIPDHTFKYLTDNNLIAARSIS